MGWENFISPALPVDTAADALTFGIVGNTPTRVYFYYNMLGHIIFTREAKAEPIVDDQSGAAAVSRQGGATPDQPGTSTGNNVGQLGWGIDLAGGIGYRFINSAHKKSGWDVGMDVFGYVTPYFLNSETGYTETAVYYGVGLGVTTIYKINPYIGMGLRVGLKYNIGAKYFSSKQPSTSGIIFTVGSLITF